MNSREMPEEATAMTVSQAQTNSHTHETKTKAEPTSPTTSPVSPSRAPIVAASDPDQPISKSSDKSTSSAKSKDGTELAIEAVAPKKTRGGGVSCHHCKISKVTELLYFCTNRDKTGPHRKQCHKKWCKSCLKRVHPSHHPSSAKQIASWICPACHDQCKCTACTANRELTLLYAARQKQQEQYSQLHKLHQEAMTFSLNMIESMHMRNITPPNDFALLQRTLSEPEMHSRLSSLQHSNPASVSPSPIPPSPSHLSKKRSRATGGGDGSTGLSPRFSQASLLSPTASTVSALQKMAVVSVQAASGAPAAAATSSLEADNRSRTTPSTPNFDGGKSAPQSSSQKYREMISVSKRSSGEWDSTRSSGEWSNAFQQANIVSQPESASSTSSASFAAAIENAHCIGWTVTSPPQSEPTSIPLSLTSSSISTPAGPSAMAAPTNMTPSLIDLPRLPPLDRISSTGGRGQPGNPNIATRRSCPPSNRSSLNRGVTTHFISTVGTVPITSPASPMLIFRDGNIVNSIPNSCSHTPFSDRSRRSSIDFSNATPNDELADTSMSEAEQSHHSGNMHAYHIIRDQMSNLQMVGVQQSQSQHSLFPPPIVIPGVAYHNGMILQLAQPQPHLPHHSSMIQTASSNRAVEPMRSTSLLPPHSRVSAFDVQSSHSASAPVGNNGLQLVHSESAGHSAVSMPGRELWCGPTTGTSMSHTDPIAISTTTELDTSASASGVTSPSLQWSDPSGVAPSHDNPAVKRFCSERRPSGNAGSNAHSPSNVGFDSMLMKYESDSEGDLTVESLMTFAKDSPVEAFKLVGQLEAQRAQLQEEYNNPNFHSLANLENTVDIELRLVKMGHQIELLRLVIQLNHHAAPHLLAQIGSGAQLQQQSGSHSLMDTTATTSSVSDPLASAAAASASNASVSDSITSVVVPGEAHKMDCADANSVDPSVATASPISSPQSHPSSNK